jgi:hypothetical protein
MWSTHVREGDPIATTACIHPKPRKGMKTNSWGREFSFKNSHSLLLLCCQQSSCPSGTLSQFQDPTEPLLYTSEIGDPTLLSKDENFPHININLETKSFSTINL